jgi:hypothetical protein
MTRDTHYHHLLAEANDSVVTRDEVTEKIDDIETLYMERARNHDSDAYLAIQEAHAEQARIANLLTVALDSHSGVGYPRFNREAREQARDMALAALGLPEGGHVRD